MNKIILSSILALFVTGVARADIASTEYFSAGDNVEIEGGTISVPTIKLPVEGMTEAGSTPADYASVYAALENLLPSSYFMDSDGWDNYWYYALANYDPYDLGFSSNLYSFATDTALYVGMNEDDGGIRRLNNAGISGANLTQAMLSLNDTKQPLVNGGISCYDESGEEVCENDPDRQTNGIVTADSEGNVWTHQIADAGTGEFITDVSVADNGAVTLTRGNVNLSGKQDKLTAGTNVVISSNNTISVPTINTGLDSIYESDGTDNDTPVATGAFSGAMQKVIPHGLLSEPEMFWEVEDSIEPWYNGSESLAEIIRDLAYDKILPLQSRVGSLSTTVSTLSNSKQDKINSVMVREDCFEEEGETICDTVYETETNNTLVSIDGNGKVVPAEIKNNNTGQFITGISVANDGAVTLTRGNVDKLTAAGSANTPVYIDATGKPAAVTSIKADLLPELSAKEDTSNKVHSYNDRPDGFDDWTQTEKDQWLKQHYTSVAYVDSRLDEISGIATDAATGVENLEKNKQDKISTEEYYQEDGLGIATTEGFVNLIKMDNPESLEEYLPEYGVEVITNLRYGTNENDKTGVIMDTVFLGSATSENYGVVKLGDALTTDANGATTVKAASAIEAGISELGTIPAGADKTGKATIWIE